MNLLRSACKPGIRLGLASHLLIIIGVMKNFVPLQAPRNPLAKYLCIGILMQGLSGCSDENRSYPVVGEPFPLAALKEIKTIEGDPYSLSGKTLLINFWATWCAPCRREMPILQNLSDSLDPNRFIVIGISVDDHVNLIREFLLQYDIRFHNFHDQDFRLASELLGIESYPQTFIVSPKGVITARISEVISLQEDVNRRLQDSERHSEPITMLRQING